MGICGERRIYSHLQKPTAHPRRRLARLTPETPLGKDAPEEPKPPIAHHRFAVKGFTSLRFASFRLDKPERRAYLACDND